MKRQKLSDWGGFTTASSGEDSPVRRSHLHFHFVWSQPRRRGKWALSCAGSKGGLFSSLQFWGVWGSELQHLLSSWISWYTTVREINNRMADTKNSIVSISDKRTRMSATSWKTSTTLQQSSSFPFFYNFSIVHSFNIFPNIGLFLDNVCIDSILVNAIYAKGRHRNREQLTVLEKLCPETICVPLFRLRKVLRKLGMQSGSQVDGWW